MAAQQIKDLWNAVTKLAPEQAVKFLKSTPNLELNNADRNGRTPLHVAAMRSVGLAIGAALVELKANVNAEDKAGVTALHLAAALGNAAFVQLLLDNNANVFSSTKAGSSALGLALETDLDVVAKITLVDKDRCNSNGRSQAATKLAEHAHNNLLASKGTWGFSGALPRTEAKVTTEKNGTWQSCEGSEFSVRQPGYEQKKGKGTSERPLYDLHAVEAFSSEVKIKHIAQYFNFPMLAHHSTERMANVPAEVPKFFVGTMLLPLYEPSNPVWGTERVDGESFNFVTVWALSEYAQEQLRENKSNAIRLLRRFFADTGFETEFTPQRPTEGVRVQLKGIGVLTNSTDLKVSSVLKSLIDSNNGKPFMTGPRCHTFYRGADYLEVDCDVHRFCYLARKGIWSLKDTIMSQGNFNFGLVVEGRGDSELPEQMLGAVNVDGFTKVRSWNVLRPEIIRKAQAAAAASTS